MALWLGEANPGLGITPRRRRQRASLRPCRATPFTTRARSRPRSSGSTQAQWKFRRAKFERQRKRFFQMSALLEMTIPEATRQSPPAAAPGTDKKYFIGMHGDRAAVERQRD